MATCCLFVSLGLATKLRAIQPSVFFACMRYPELAKSSLFNNLLHRVYEMFSHFLQGATTFLTTRKILRGNPLFGLESASSDSIAGADRCNNCVCGTSEFSSKVFATPLRSSAIDSPDEATGAAGTSSFGAGGSSTVSSSFSGSGTASTSTTGSGTGAGSGVGSGAGVGAGVDSAGESSAAFSAVTIVAAALLRRRSTGAMTSGPIMSGLKFKLVDVFDWTETADCGGGAVNPAAMLAMAKAYNTVSLILSRFSSL